MRPFTADPSLRDALKTCGEVSRRSGSSFRWAFLLLSGEQRAAMEVLYAFFRHSDDLADDVPGAEHSPSGAASSPRRAKFHSWRAALESGLESGGAGEHLSLTERRILQALERVIERYAIPRRYFSELLRGCERDLDPAPFADFGEVEAYCRDVASTVGLACIHVWGFTSPEIIAPSTACGVAFQLTNILRDAMEDVARRRVYFAQDELLRYGLTPRDFLEAPTPRLADFLTLQFERAFRYYEQALQTQDYLRPAGRRAFRIMYATYYSLLKKLMRRRREGEMGRISLRRGEKCEALIRGVFGRLA